MTTKPIWAKKVSVHIQQLELIIKSISSLLSTLQEAIFAFKKTLVAITGFTGIYALFDKLDFNLVSKLLG
ncbi:hypothetical protein [Shewanella fidelis]|uniref:Uncharacterized protein n=1 Tax=Shewanella fidelis TaxID=173509 RepID=A0AAW8NS59_9GAMM|nr:hypothetical protein [Shewanella fidelis]MDR8525041.1 hypothetical protein [Shewanella fidelis]MDW4811112.1 hypothetical protein [Shewanella fidelis]MDW4815109.1 hypothetical protein [Shewanella fidelis]MDW4819199.1 hypothetical protein [Shewanella fidelis]MDW4823123.1 hypothetical protein [Shewanella fidelis]